MEMIENVSPARERVLAMMNAAWMCQAIGVACELDLPERLAAGPAPAAQLSEALGVSADALHRLLRALATLGLIDQHDDDAFGLNDDGVLLTRSADGSLHGWAIMNAARGWRLWGALAQGVRTGHNVRELANLDAYADFERDPNAARAFNRAMGSLTHPVALALRDRVAFRGDETVVDVGGGAGHLIAPLLAGFPRMRGIVFDLAHSRAQAEEVLASQGLGDRCQFISGSFFDDVPRGADVVLLKSVLHNWDDAHARRILDACRAAMPPGSRLLVVERILAGRIGRTAMDRENARSDLQMLLACDGRERDERAFRSLLGTAGFRVGTITPLTPLVAAIEAHVAG